MKNGKDIDGKGLKVFILGLDGATFEIIEPLMQRGQLPNLRSLMERSVHGKLRSTIPNMSAPAWGAFMTGKNPGKLGVYDFYTYDPTNYSFLEPRLITSAPMAGQTVWDILGDRGYRVGVITVPVTYPPWEVNGFMISGYPCPDSKSNFTHPPELAESLDLACNWSADIQRTSTLREMAQAGYAMMSTRTETALDLLRRYPCDIFCMVLGATDMAQHYFWKYSTLTSQNGGDLESEFGDVLTKTYQRADECLGRLLQVTSDDTLIIVMSDHGGAAAPSLEVNTNSWLRELGLLQLVPGRHFTDSFLRGGIRFFKKKFRRWAKIRPLLPGNLRNKVRQLSFNVAAIDWSATRAYRFPMSPPAEGLVINVAGRQKEGIVQPGEEYEQLRSFLIDRVRELRDENKDESIVEDIYRREELYSGEHIWRAPDLVIIFKPEYMGGNGLESALLTDHVVGRVNGQHSLDGIFLMRGGQIRENVQLRGAHILDVAPTILYALGAPIPKDMDGTVLRDAFRESHLRSQPIVYSEPLGTSRDSHETLTAEEEETMREKLKSLGYLS